MRDSTLLSPGLLSQGYNLRRVAASAISSCEIVAARTPGGKTAQSLQLQLFFTDCANQLTPLVDAVAPTIVSRVAATATRVNMTFSENMDTTVLPPISAFSSAGNTVTDCSWTSATVLRINGTGFAATENFTYTLPVVNFIRDLAGTAVATSSAALT